jgi:glycosyltransferase involved in cell wall biosynthesis
MPSAAPRISTLQLGEGWFPETAGGLNRMYYELLRYLPGSDVEVHGLVAGASRTYQDSQYKVKAFARADAPLLWRLWKARRMLRETMAEYGTDLVASHFGLYTVPALDILRWRPLVFHFHGPWALESKLQGARTMHTRVKTTIERSVYHRANLCIVLSSAFYKILQRDYGVQEDRIRVVPGGVEVDRFATNLSRREARERLGWPQDRPVVFTVRRLVRRMGLEDLISAAKEVRREVPDLLLMIAGKGELAGELQARISALNLENSTKLLGFLPDEDLPVAYRAADLTIVPTVALEGFGLIAAESLAAGTPALVTPVGGLPEVVNGLSRDLVLPGNGTEVLAEGLSAALSGKLGLPDTRKCQSYARARYDWPVIASSVRDVYAEALA